MMLQEYLTICMEISGATGGSILAEEGAQLQFLFSDKDSLIGIPVPWNSIAGETVRNSHVIYTYAPADKRHFSGVDSKTSLQTRYLLSIPITSIHSAQQTAEGTKSSGALQLLFDSNIVAGEDVSTQPLEFTLQSVREQPFFEQNLKGIFWILPNIAFGMEVMRLRQTSYQVIHELKNKCIGAESWLACLNEDLADEIDPSVVENEIISEDLELATNAAHEGAQIAKGYLQFTKLYDPKFQPIEVNSVIKQIGANVRAFASERGADELTVVCDLDPSIPKREMDPDQLKMALFNLCKNAVEALVEHQEGKGEVRLVTALDRDRLIVTIRDNGPGMPKEIADNLFKPFSTKKEGGTGLGLTITKKIVDIHGGTIICTTGAKGTSFVVDFGIAAGSRE